MMRGEGGGIRRKVPMTISGFIFKKKVQKDVPLFHPFLAREKKKHPQASNDPLLPKIAILTAY